MAKRSKGTPTVSRIAPYPKREWTRAAAIIKAMELAERLIALSDQDPERLPFDLFHSLQGTQRDEALKELRLLLPCCEGGGRNFRSALPGDFSHAISYAVSCEPSEFADERIKLVRSISNRVKASERRRLKNRQTVKREHKKTAALIQPSKQIGKENAKRVGEAYAAVKDTVRKKGALVREIMCRTGLSRSVVFEHLKKVSPTR